MVNPGSKSRQCLTVLTRIVRAVDLAPELNSALPLLVTTRFDIGLEHLSTPSNRYPDMFPTVIVQNNATTPGAPQP